MKKLIYQLIIGLSILTSPLFAQYTSEKAFAYIRHLYDHYDTNLFEFLVNEIDQYLESFPTGEFAPQALFMLAHIYSQEGNRHEALATFLKIICLYPGNDRQNDCNNNITEIIKKEPSSQDQTEMLMTLMAQNFNNSRSVDNYFKYLEFLVKLDHPKLYYWAIAELNHFVNRFPNDLRNDQVLFRIAEFHNKIAMADRANLFKKSKDDFVIADACYQKIQFLYPASPLVPESRYRRGLVYRDINQHHKAIKVLAEIVTESPASAWAVEALVTAGEIWEKNLKDYKLAITEYRKLVELYPDSKKAIDALERIAEISLKQKDYAAAITTYNEIVEKYPGNPKALTASISLCKIYENNLSDLDRVAETYVKFVEVFPDYEKTPDFVLYAASLYEKNQQFLKAGECYEILVRKYPTHEGAKVARTKLAEAKFHATALINVKEWNLKILDTARNAPYLNEIEKDVILEVNKLRGNPKKYAEQYLVELKELYHGALLQYPGETAIRTNEGIKAVDDCYKALMTASPSRPLIPTKGMCRAAADLVQDQAKTGKTGHESSDGSTSDQRLNRYGRWDGYCGENVSYGPGDARRIVLQLLIDDGVPTRGHRKNLLDDKFGFIGVACGTHKKYRYMCVQVFATSYTDN